MVERGNCKFTTKTNAAEAAGASAVLIINNQKGNLHICFCLLMCVLTQLKLCKGHTK